MRRKSKEIKRKDNQGEKELFREYEKTRDMDICIVRLSVLPI